MDESISFEDIFHHTGYGVVAIDRWAIITHINNRAKTLLKLDSRLHLGRNITEILPFADDPVQQCLRTGEEITGRQISWRKAGLVLNVVPVVKRRRIHGAVCSVQELRNFGGSDPESPACQDINLQLETIFHASSDGIWVCNGKGIVISINKASETLNGIKPHEVIGHSIDDLLARRVFDQSVTTLVMASKKRETVMQYIARTKRFLLSTGTPSLDDNGNIALIVINERDMTELNTLRRQVEESQKAKEKFKDELSGLSLLELERNSIIADSSRMRHVLQMSLKLSHIGASNILVLGESGTGKGLIAKLIHKNSNRRKKPFIEINCAALPENLLEAELFGYEKGAFTGASDKGKVGLVELAHGGTLFLDEIGDMPLSLQAKLLKYLDNQEIRRLGGTESIQTTCSVIAATNQNLKRRVQEKLFREDLYYRLRSFIIEIPPLRERIDDISGLIRFYLGEFNTKYSCSKTISPQGIRALQSYGFPGNIRELKSIIENGVVMSEESHIDEFVQLSIKTGKPPAPSAILPIKDAGDLNLPAAVERIEEELLRRARSKFGTTRQMAYRLGVSQPSVVRKMKKYKIH